MEVKFRRAAPSSAPVTEVWCREWEMVFRQRGKSTKQRQKGIKKYIDLASSLGGRSTQ